MNNPFVKLYKKNITKNDVYQETDDALINSYKNEQDSFFVGVLFERYTHLVFGVCMKYLHDKSRAKDAVMDIFEKLMEDLMMREIRNFKSWLYQVTKNHCLMILREASPKMVNIEDDIENKTIFMESGHEKHHTNKDETEWRGDGLEQAIQQLKEEQKNCIELMYLQNKSYKEITDITGFPMKKVKSFIQNGKRNLKIILENRKEP